MSDESMEYDVVIVGAGPAGLSAAIKLKQLAKENNQTISVGILEKSAEIGGHILSGAVIEPKVLQDLLTNDWQNSPLDTLVSNDRFYLFTKNKALRLPTPAPMKNHGNYIISLGALCQHLAKVAESLGCDIFPGFAAYSPIIEQNSVKGIITGEFGVAKDGSHTPNYQPGIKIYAKQTFFAEGCRGHITEQLIKKFELRKKSSQQTYALGIKEVWQIPKSKHQAGLVMHSVGWPLDYKTYGGSFMYHWSKSRVSIGFVVGLDYENPWLNPFETMQTFKSHPFIKSYLVDGKRIGYGAKALNEGGWQSVPNVIFPGGVLIGDCAGFLNVAKIKGIHTAMQSGVLAAEAYIATLSLGNIKNTDSLRFVDNCSKSLTPPTFHGLSAESIDPADKPRGVGLEVNCQQTLNNYAKNLKQSWVMDELYKVRNLRPGFGYGLYAGLALAGLETYLFRGKSPWTLQHKLDHLSLKPANLSKKINYAKPDNSLIFDRLSSVYLANTFHEENEPCHLKIKDPTLPISVNFNQYASPETRYCPAGVYEIVHQNGDPVFQINAQNCIHCKTCDIKDPKQNILWTPPQGGEGPKYSDM